MKLRKNRPHVQGATNKDFRKVPQDRPEDKTQLEFLATAKANNFDEMIKQRIEKTAPEPSIETQKFYQENQKDFKEHTKVGYPRFGQLEEPELRKRVFNGESYTHFDPTHKLNSVSKKMTMSDAGQDMEEKLINFKHEDYTKQIQETQLVGIQHNTESLQGQVDLLKVKEIRRALRRRYANRKNFQKIYNAWDVDSLGKITVKNAYDMIQKLGIKANVNECRVLVASVDQDFSGSIGLDEFMDLIFNDSDNLNVDLNRIPLFDAQVIRKDENQGQFEADIAVESKTVRDMRHQNQLSMILKNKAKGLANLFRIADEFNSGFITQEKLEEILEKQNIPESIMSKHDRQYLFDQQKFDDYKFNYKQFINQLNDFQFRPDDIYKDPRDLRKEQTQQQRIISTFKEAEDKRIYVFNNKRVNSWHLEKIRADFRKVKRIMSRYLENKDDFQQLFMQQHKINAEDELQNIDISKKQLTQFVQNMFLNVGEKDVKKHEIENFLSIFQYNNHDYTRVQDLASKIYEQNDAQWYEEVQRNINNPPPPADLKFHPDFPPEHRTKKSTSLHHNQEGQFTQRVNSDQDVDLVQPPLDNRRTQTAQPNMKRKSYLSKELQQQSVNSNVRLQDILKKLEDRVFCGSQRAYSVFKNFDQDKDGYVSQKDLVNKLQELSILNNDEIRIFLDYVDPNGDGQLNFRQFSDKIRDGTYYTDTQGMQTFVPGTQPGKEYLDSMRHIFPRVRQQHENLQKQFLPDEKLRPSNRFQYTPSYKNTFIYHRPGIHTPQYQSEDARFKQTHNHRTEWQKSELKKKYGYENARVKTKKDIYNKQQSQKKQIEDAYWDKQQSRFKSKGVLQWTYEHRAHLQNNWHGGGINLVQEIREEKEKEKVKPPLYGKWVKN